MLDFNTIYNELMENLGEKKVSEFIDSGSVACAVIAENEKIYYGKNYQAGCGLSQCSEKVALSNCIMDNNTKIKYVLVVFKNGKILRPCGSCIELLAQMGKHNLETEIITSLNPLKTIKLKDVLTDWWGMYRYS